MAHHQLGIEHADYAICFFDRRRHCNENLGGGRWVSQVKVGSNIETIEHFTEALARRAIGLDGGSSNTQYRPPTGRTGLAVAKGCVAA